MTKLTPGQAQAAAAAIAKAVAAEEDVQYFQAVIALALGEKPDAASATRLIFNILTAPNPSAD